MPSPMLSSPLSLEAASLKSSGMPLVTESSKMLLEFLFRAENLIRGATILAPLGNLGFVEATLDNVWPLSLFLTSLFFIALTNPFGPPIFLWTLSTKLGAITRPPSTGPEGRLSTATEVEAAAPDILALRTPSRISLVMGSFLRAETRTPFFVLLPPPRIVFPAFVSVFLNTDRPKSAFTAPTTPPLANPCLCILSRL